MNKILNVRASLMGIVCYLLILTNCSNPPETGVGILYQEGNPLLDFAVGEIQTALESRNYHITINPGTDKLQNNPFRIRLEIPENSAEDLNAEGFRLRKAGEGNTNAIHVAGADAAGAMYGGLELAEQIRIYGWDGVKDMERSPYMKMRGTKFNIPLDVRTPSYTDPCDAAQQNIANMWSFDFWKDYLDNLARYRYNYVSLWSLHPFPSLVKVPEYPDVALDDVQRSTTEWKEFYSLNGIGFDAPEIIDNVEILKQMTIDEKIEFWQKVMAYGKSRNIDFYIVTWNIFVNGTRGLYGITDDINNEITRDYFRQSVKQLFLTYPDLAGIGLTTGENMHGASTAEKEDWAFESYARGMMDAAAEQPERQFRFIHRQHQTGAMAIAERFRELIEVKNIDFIFSYKYAKAHVFSSTIQPFCRDFVEEIEGMRTIWTLRNDDSYIFRWGAPDFVREFIRNIPYEVSQGFYYGSDQWIWGREFLHLEPESPRQLEIVKHWYNWTLWGRLGYDPQISNERFIAILSARYPEVDGTDLFSAWQEASMIYPLTTGFHWGSLDFQWYIESSKSHPRYSQNETGFHDVNRFINLPPHPGRPFQSIPDHTEMIQAGGSTDLVTPYEISDRLHKHADRAQHLLDGMDPGDHTELKHTLTDIQAVTCLGKYYAHKVRGATELDLYRKTGMASHQAAAIEELTKAAEYWRLFVDAAAAQYKNPLWLNRVGVVNWEQIYEWVLEDIEIARMASSAAAP